MSTCLNRVLSALRSKGLAPRKSGKGWSCRCPAHDDRTPSLSIDAGEDGRTLVNCHAGCTAEAVCEAMGLRVVDLFEQDRSRTNGQPTRSRRSTTTDNPPAVLSGHAVGVDARQASGRTFATARDAVAELRQRHGSPDATWTYTNAEGEPVGLVVRWDRHNGKDVRPVSLSADGACWVIGGMPEDQGGRPLYALPDLQAATGRVWVCEGEKAAEAARAVGLVATTSPHGSNSAHKADWSPLAGRDVVVLPDRDDAGDHYADDVARLATAAGAKSVRVVRLADLWTDLPKGGDMADLLENREADINKIREEVESLATRAEATVPKPAVIDGAPLIVRLADVKPERVAWLWPGRIALGKLTLIAGDPGLGKSFVTLDMAARVSRGAAWPDAPSVQTTPGGVVLLNAEDGVADTIRPRLDAAGADVDRVVALEAIGSVSDNGQESDRTFDLSRDLTALEEAIRSVHGCRLVVIDPVTAYLGGVDSHKNAEIRGLLAPLGAIADRQQVAVVAVTHLNKSNNGPAIYRAMGSLAFAAAARAAWSVSKDKNDPDRRLLLPIKNNIAPDTGGLAYRIEPSGVDGCPAVSWEPDAVQLNADDALGGERPECGVRSERDDAAEWLSDLLADGPSPARDVQLEAKDAGFSIATLRRAKAAIGVMSRKEAFGGPWAWCLPETSEVTHSANMPNPVQVSTLGIDERLGVLALTSEGESAEDPQEAHSVEVSAIEKSEHRAATPTHCGDGRGEL